MAALKQVEMLGWKEVGCRDTLSKLLLSPTNDLVEFSPQHKRKRSPFSQQSDKGRKQWDNYNCREWGPQEPRLSYPPTTKNLELRLDSQMKLSIQSLHRVGKR